MGIGAGAVVTMAVGGVVMVVVLWMGRGEEVGGEGGKVHGGVGGEGRSGGGGGTCIRAGRDGGCHGIWGFCWGWWRDGV